MITLANYNTYTENLSAPAWYRAERYDYCDGFLILGRKHVAFHQFIANIKSLFTK